MAKWFKLPKDMRVGIGITEDAVVDLEKICSIELRANAQVNQAIITFGFPGSTMERAFSSVAAAKDCYNTIIQQTTVN